MRPPGCEKWAPFKTHQVELVRRVPGWRPHVMSYLLENNYIPMEKMFLHADDIEDNRKSAETYLNKALGMDVLYIFPWIGIE